jgi:hypothetical protein
MSELINHLRSIWYPSEALEVPCSPNQFLGWDFFVISYSKPGFDSDTGWSELTSSIALHSFNSLVCVRFLIVFDKLLSKNNFTNFSFLFTFTKESVQLTVNQCALYSTPPYWLFLLYNVQICIIIL